MNRQTNRQLVVNVQLFTLNKVINKVLATKHEAETAKQNKK
jgi:hypothetical protein